MKTTQGYFFIALGRIYIDEAVNLLKSIKIFDQSRKFGILINDSDFDYTNNLNLFDSIIINDYSNELYNYAKTPFERYCLIPRITFNEYLPFDENLIIDTDVICIYDPTLVWKYFESSAQNIGMTGFSWDETWHWGTIQIISETIGVKIPHTHGGIFYIRNKESLKNYFNQCHNIFHLYDDFKLLRNFRGGRVDEPIFAIAMALNNMTPLDFIEYPIITFNLKHDSTIPTNIQTVNELNFECKHYIPFVHMFEKSDGINYKILLNRILNV